MTLTEIAKMGKASIIIPSPNVVDNHQYKNAKVLADEGAAVLICEYEMSEEGESKVCQAVDKISSDAEYRSAMEQKIRTFAKDDVEKRIFDAIIELIESKKK